MTKLVRLVALLTLLTQVGKSQTNPSFLPPANYPGSADNICVGDFNGDTKPDLFLNSSNSLIYLNNGSGGFSSQPGPSSYGMYPLYTGDLNGDGMTDLVRVYPGGSSSHSRIGVSLNTGSGTFGPYTYYTVGLNMGEPYIGGITMADFNADGKIDIAGTKNNYPGSPYAVFVLLNQGSGTFGAQINVASISDLYCSCVSSDINGDSKTDLIIKFANKVVVMINTSASSSNLSFAPTVNYNIGNSQQNWFNIAVGDFNNDSKPDIAAINSNDNNISVLFNMGTDSFANPVNYLVGHQPTSIVTADFNGDGKTDIAASNNYDDNISILINKGTGSFDPPVNYETSGKPLGLIVADFNGDGKPDLATGGAGSVSVLLSAPPAPPAPTYPSLPSNLCVGSSINKTPSVSGGGPDLTYIIDSFAVSAPKAICKNQNGVFVLNANDSILFYNSNGVLQPAVYNNIVFANVSAITADNSNRVYAVVPDPNNNAISTVCRFLPDGSWDASYTFPSYVFGYITAMAYSPADGYVYIADTTTGYLNRLDTGTATYTGLPMPSNNLYSYDKPAGIAFGANNTLYLFDKGLKQVLRRDPSDNNYYPAIPGLDTLSWNINAFDIDTAG